MSGHRQAAVALYSLAASDQERILAELPDGDQRILKDYLAELAALGFDKAANMSEAVATPAVRAAAPADASARLRAAPAAAVMATLQNEPATLIAQLLALQAWPWSHELLELLSPQRRKLVREATEAVKAAVDLGAAPARARFLTDAVAAALPAVEPAAVARLPVRLSRWFPWTR